jgi:hypothetical protein
MAGLGTNFGNLTLFLANSTVENKAKRSMSSSYLSGGSAATNCFHIEVVCE